jgi:regulator of replication initiation timing
MLNSTFVKKSHLKALTTTIQELTAETETLKAENVDLKTKLSCVVYRDPKTGRLVSSKNK